MTLRVCIWRLGWTICFAGAGGAWGQELPRAVANWLEAQVVLAREGFSSGSIDGVPGPQTEAALRAYQEREGLEVSGKLDDATRERLRLAEPLLERVRVGGEDVERLQPLSPTWLGKSEQTALAFETVLEMVSERARANPKLVRRLNPAVNWDGPLDGVELSVPSVRLGFDAAAVRVARVHIFMSERILQARDEEGRIVLHCPVSIAREVAKRPEGEVRVTVVIPDPDYTFNPAVFPESEEARQLGRKLILAPGPNNPVGVAWIGLDRPGYGIHGTPTPEQVGRTESHGCFRLANWDARTLLQMAWVGLPVHIIP